MIAKIFLRVEKKILNFDENLESFNQNSEENKIMSAIAIVEDVYTKPSEGKLTVINLFSSDAEFFEIDGLLMDLWELIDQKRSQQEIIEILLSENEVDGVSDSALEEELKKAFEFLFEEKLIKLID